jgi:uncharacterized membrane protein
MGAIIWFVGFLVVFLAAFAWMVLNANKDAREGGFSTQK